jgi:predicted HNH restriction endonuclease
MRAEMEDEEIDYTDPPYIPSADDFVSYLKAHPLSDHQRDLLLAHYAAPNHAARTIEIAQALGIAVQAVHATYGHLGRRIETDLDLEMPEEAIPTQVFSWIEPADGFHDLRLHDAVVEAIEKLGWAREARIRFREAYESEADPEAAPSRYFEGRAREAQRIERARNGRARQECVDSQGTVCTACGFDFAAFYGQRGEGFIEVHHVRPMGESGGEREIDPQKELRPVCSNCHRMLHRFGETISIEKLQELIRAQATRDR